jgi:ATP-dependent Zn protease
MAKPSRPKPLNDRRHTAIHEAGHAVIGRVMTLVCGGTTIVPNYKDGTAGRTIIAEPHECVDEWRKRGKVRVKENAIFHGRIMAYMAGVEAEVILLGSTKGGDRDDRRQIELMVEELDHDPADWGRWEVRLRCQARRLIRRHRDIIELVADELLVNEKLSAKQVDKLTGRSVNDVKVNAPEQLWLHGQRKR